MQNYSNYKAYLNEISESILDSARDTVKDRKKTKKGSEAYSFDSGRIHAYYDVLLYLQDYLEPFGIDPKEVHLDGVDLDKEFIV